MEILVAWIGNTDLRAAGNDGRDGLGPIAQAAVSRHFDSIHLLSNYPPQEASGYQAWLQPQTHAKIIIHEASLPSPTHYRAIHEAAAKVLTEIKISTAGAEFSFHLSPGTPAMAAVWILLAKTRFPATLIESSKEHGVRDADVPFDISAELIPSLFRESDQQLENYSLGLPPDEPGFEDIVHRSEAMDRVLQRAQKVAIRSVPVLIEGESGTGKELLARAIHRAGPRRENPFVAVNCGAIPAELVESEFFGYKRGAFTGAVQDRKGYFEQADGGTLFLDEIGELPLPAQVKILRVLQEGEVCRLGDARVTKVDVRIISATNRKLIDDVSKGLFRSDLFYRLAVAILTLPPLREREGDVGLLVDFFLDRINEECASEAGYVHKKISPSAKNLILEYPWPGNVRELQNTLRRTAVWSTGAVITPEDVRDALLPVNDHVSDGILDRPLGEMLNLQELLGLVARHYLQRAMHEANGNKTKAARLVGLPNYQTLTNWLEKYKVLE